MSEGAQGGPTYSQGLKQTTAGSVVTVIGGGVMPRELSRIASILHQSINNTGKVAKSIKQ